MNMEKLRISGRRAVGAWAGLAATLLLCTVSAQAQSSITGVYPDGKTLFQATNSLAFTAASTAGVQDISVQLTGTKLTGETFLKTYSLASGLTVSGSDASKLASAPLAANIRYSAVIEVTDTTGNKATSSVTFDTITPAYTFEAEDYDYDGGQFIDNPQTNAYRGLSAVDGVDAHNGANGNQDYRPHDSAAGGLATEGCGDTPRAQYATSGQTDYDVGWNNNGNWANYTRHFPAGKYNLFMRGANPNGAGTDSAQVSGAVEGIFGVPNTGGWQVYTWIPLKDSEGNLVEFTLDGSAQTMTISTTGGNYNANFYMLFPAIEQGTETADATISSMAPDGAMQFQAADKFTFTVDSTQGINPADIVVQLGATNLAGIGTSTLLTSASGLAITGSATSREVSLNLASNMVYKAFIQITDANGVSLATNVLFDTITPFYTWEAEDWDYGSGQYFDNAEVNTYAGYDGVSGIDFLRLNTDGGQAYGRDGLSTEVCGDVPRANYVDAQDYDIGNNSTGNWVNYTRNWPAGIYNIYIRVANGNSSTTTGAGTLSLVASGAGTANQTLTQIGTYDSPGVGNWQRYSWQAVRDSAGNLAKFVGGGVKTLRHTVAGGNANQGFYMLMPADLSAHTLPFVDNISPNGSAMFQPVKQLSFTVHSDAGIATSNVVLTLNGIQASQLAFSGSANQWNVTCPVPLNGFYRAVLTLTDDFGTSTSRFEFGTFDSATAYIFEAEDYDYSGGQFIDNPQVNGYANLEAIAEVDTHTVDGNFDGTHVPYRPSGLNQENANDIFVAPGRDGAQNYDLGNTAAGNWGNYTRTFPAGTYNIYMRAANGNTTTSSGGSMEVVTSGRGTADQTTSPLGTFDSVPATSGWQSYTWVPLRDSSGNLAEFTGGGVKTLRAICGGGQNNDYYMLVPADPGKPVLSGLYPDGTALFQQTNTLSFVAESTAGIESSDIHLTLNGVEVKDLAITGSTARWTASYAKLAANTAYTATISFTTKSGAAFAKTYSFDTFSASYYTWEAEDYNYGGGQYIDNPQPGAYNGLEAVDGVDAHNTDGGGAYRPVGTAEAPGGLATEACGDVARTAYIGTGATDYDVGYTSAGDWANYTRKFPQGAYNIYLRAANPNAAGTDTIEISGPVSGQFNVPNTGNWQVYTWVPMVDASGKLVVFNADGNAQTLKIATIAGIYNANFYMLAPAASSGVTGPKLSATRGTGQLDLSFATQSGASYQVQYKTSLNDAEWTNLGSAVSGNGSTQTVSDPLGSNARFYRVKVQ